jgi:hypothetical protein
MALLRSENIVPIVLYDLTTCHPNPAALTCPFSNPEGGLPLKTAKIDLVFNATQ